LESLKRMVKDKKIIMENNPEIKLQKAIDFLSAK
jgi:hypothetical protein